MVPFAGFNMPVQYAGLKEEHHAVRDRVGMFDVSHMGEFFVSGPDALALVQWVSSNDASALFDGKVQYSCMPNGRGGIVDDLLVYRTGGRPVHACRQREQPCQRLGLDSNPSRRQRLRRVAGRRQRQACADRASRPRSPSASSGSCPRPARTVSLGKI